MIKKVTNIKSKRKIDVNSFDKTMPFTTKIDNFCKKIFLKNRTNVLTLNTKEIIIEIYKTFVYFKRWVMISELHIKNIGIIDEITVKLNEGFNVLTGETGARKNINCR